MSADLAREQEALLAALWAPRRADAVARAAAHLAGTAWERGLAAYRSNGLALAERALAGAYPAVAALVGAETFAALARECWRRHPPGAGDLGVWGGDLPALIESLAELQAQEPYLADVARLEWALHQAATAADAPADLDSLALLAQTDPTRLRLAFAPGAWVMESAYPAASVLRAHLEDAPTLEEAGARLRAGVREAAVVWRQGLRPRVREALPGEPALLARLLAGSSLADALDASPSLDFQAWLAQAVRSGLLLGACPSHRLGKESP